MNSQTKGIAAVVGVIVALAALVFSYVRFMAPKGPGVTPEEGLKKRQEMEAHMKAGGKAMIESKMKGGGRPGGPYMKMGKPGGMPGR